MWNGIRLFHLRVERSLNGLRYPVVEIEQDCNGEQGLCAIF